MKSIISTGENRFLSRGGILVLLKAVLQSILVYWASIAYIQKKNSNENKKEMFLFPMDSEQTSRRNPSGKMECYCSSKGNRWLGNKKSGHVLQSLSNKNVMEASLEFGHAVDKGHDF